MDLKKLYKNVSSKLVMAYIDNKKKIDIGLRLTNIVQHTNDGKYADAMNSTISMFSEIGKEYFYGGDLLNDTNGWKRLFDNNEKNVITLFNLESYPFREIKVGNGDIKIYTLPNKAEIATFKSAYYWQTQTFEYYNANISTKEEVMEVLNKDAFKYVDSSCICLSSPDGGKQGLALVSYELNEYPSEAAIQLTKYANNAIDSNITRAIMLCGEPGSGKSCVASTLLKKLDLKTLVIKDMAAIGFETIKLVIDMLKIEAVLIDDLDHKSSGNNSAMLDFLEKIRKQVKIVIATVNSTKEFHKALLRPGRFDKIFTVNKLDEQTIKNLLGSELEPYFDKVSGLPIAYINEFVLSAKLEDKENLDIVIDDLQKRFSSDSINLDLELKTYLQKAMEAAEKTKAKMA